MAVAKKNYKGYRRLPTTTNIPLLTTAPEVVVGVVNADVFTEQRRILSVEVTWSLEDLTDLDGPIEVGIAHSDYTDAEVEECLEAGGSWDEGDKVAQEQARRLVRRVGVLTEEETALNEGRLVKTRLNWRVSTGDTLRWWARNRGDALTTGAVVIISGVLHTVLV